MIAQEVIDAPSSRAAPVSGQAGPPKKSEIPDDKEMLRAAVELQAAALLSIAPPVGRSWDFSGIEIPTVPWLVIQGEADEIVDPQAVFDWLAGLPRQPQLVRMPDTSHFFHRKLMDLRGAVKHGVRDWLPVA